MCKHAKYIINLTNCLGMQVIALTEELLESAKQNEKSGMITGTGSDVSHSLHHPEGVSPHYLVNYFLV